MLSWNALRPQSLLALCRKALEIIFMGQAIVGLQREMSRRDSRYLDMPFINR